MYETYTPNIVIHLAAKVGGIIDNINKPADYFSTDEKFLRPEELHDLKGDSSKLTNKTEWFNEYTFETMLDEMINHWLLYYTDSKS